MKASLPEDIDLIAIVGHTAGGKTAVAARLAMLLGGEVISGDSRQVYRGMDLGTGKDYDDYLVEGTRVPYHLVDIRNAGERYSLFDYQKDFLKAYRDIRSRGLIPVLCGGTGLYVESVLKGYPLEEVPEDEEFRLYCAGRSDEELAGMLREYGPLHNKTDIVERPRLIRALEIASHERPAGLEPAFPHLTSRVFGIVWQREERRKRITDRLLERLNNGMVDEVRTLLLTVPPKDLIYYGLEYKYLTLYCTGKISYDSMVSQLNTAIHQFSKRQQSWFRRMESRGIPITWIPGELLMEQKIKLILDKL